MARCSDPEMARLWLYVTFVAWAHAETICGGLGRARLTTTPAVFFRLARGPFAVLGLDKKTAVTSGERCLDLSRSIRKKRPPASSTIGGAAVLSSKSRLKGRGSQPKAPSDGRRADEWFSNLIGADDAWCHLAIALDRRRTSGGVCMTRGEEV